MDVRVAGRVAAIAVALALAGCQPPDPSTSTPTPTPTPTPAAQAAPIALEVDALSLVLPWDVSATPSHTIQCAYDQEGGGAGCVNHRGDDRYALDLDLGSTDMVRAVESGIVRWAGLATAGWSCYGNSVAIDTSGSRMAGSSPPSMPISRRSRSSRASWWPGGTPIGTAGSSGSGVAWKSATDSGTCPNMDPHLHLALYENPSYVDATGKLSGLRHHSPAGGPARADHGLGEVAARRRHPR